MTILSVYDDFMVRSLSHLKNEFEKLYFLIGLRGQDGNFHHWGMEKIHGRQKTHIAMQQAYIELVASLPKSDIDKCWNDLEHATKDFSEFHKQICEISTDLEKHSSALLPASVKDHASLVLFLIERLAQYRTFDQAA